MLVPVLDAIFSYLSLSLSLYIYIYIYIYIYMLFLPLWLFQDILQCTLMILAPQPYTIPKSKFWKILVENTIIISQEINKLWLQILKA